MKKILLALMMISSFALAVSDSYSYNGKTYYLTSSNSRGQDYWTDLLPQIFSTGENTIIVVSLEGASSVSDWQNYCSSACSVGTNTISYYDSTAIPQIPICTSNQHLENNVCVENPICYLGTHNDPANPQNCIDDFPITKTDYLESGGVLIHYDDNKIMLLRRDGTGESWDLTTGEYFFPNRAFDGVVPPSASYNPFYFDKSQAIEYKELTFGDVAGIAFNQAGVAIKDVANWLQAPSLVWTLALSTHKDTPTDTISKSGVSVTVSDHSSNNIDLSTYENSASSQPQPIPNTDIQVQKITTPPNPKDPNNWAGAGSTIKGYTGVATVGDVVATSASNPNKALIDTPTDIKFVQKNPDGSMNETIFNKQDLKNTASSDTNLPFEQSTIQPSKMSNDGTYSAKKDTTESTIKPLTNEILETSKRTGLPLYVDYNPRTGLKDGQTYNTDTGLPVGISPTGTAPGISPVAPTIPAPAGGTGSIDLSGVTSRLDKISNQLTLENQFFEKLDKATASETVNPIDHVKGQGLIDTFSTSWENIKSDFDRITVMTDEAQNTIKQGFTFSLAHGSVNECAYTLDFDYGVGKSVINVDFCKSFSPLRPTLYVLFNLFFQSILLLFAFKSITRLV